MSGTTLCPHCNTRFKIAEPQLEAHHGMVRCGQCLQAFDARPDYIPDQPNPQLELLIPNEPATAENAASAEDAGLADTAQPADEAVMQTEHPETARDDLLDIGQPVADEPVALTLAEQVTIVQDEEEGSPPPAHRTWPWAIAAFLLLLALLAQAAYFFRVDLATRLPGLKPALAGYCKLLGCSVPLPQEADLMSIESSDLEADPAHENQITLNALLRNRAAYPQAFPHLELTLNDTQDRPLARRIFRPEDYLPPSENGQTGLLPNHELIVKLRLNTAELRPTGYRLALFYPQR